MRSLQLSLLFLWVLGCVIKGGGDVSGELWGVFVVEIGRWLFISVVYRVLTGSAPPQTA